MLALVAAVSTPAHAGKITDARAQASAAEHQLNALYARSDAAVEAYNRAVAQLHSVRQAIARNTVLLTAPSATWRPRGRSSPSSSSRPTRAPARASATTS